MPKWPVIGADDQLRSDGDQRWVAYGGDLQSGSETSVQQEARATYTASNHRAFYSNFTGDAGEMTHNFRKNGADGNMTLAINGSGEHEDTSNTDSLASGDLFNTDMDHSAGMHAENHIMNTCMVTLDAAGNEPMMVAAGDLTSGWDTGSRESCGFFGRAPSSNTETDVEYTFSSSVTMGDWRVVCGGVTTNDVLTRRKNLAAGNASLTIDGTGEFLDTSNTDSYVDNDEGNFDSATGDVSLSTMSQEADTVFTLLGSRSNTANGLNFHDYANGNWAGVEAHREIEAEAAASISNAYGLNTTFIETRTYQSRKNRANGNVTYTVTGTGVFEDTSNTDTLAAEDDHCWSQQAGGSMAGQQVYFVVEWDGDPSGDWTAIGDGRWTVFVTYIDYGAAHTQNNP